MWLRCLMIIPSCHAMLNFSTPLNMFCMNSVLKLENWKIASKENYRKSTSAEWIFIFMGEIAITKQDQWKNPSTVFFGTGLAKVCLFKRCQKASKLLPRVYEFSLKGTFKSTYKTCMKESQYWLQSFARHNLKVCMAIPFWTE